MCDITLIIKWYHLVQLVISLSSKVISHNNQGDITSKARWYHILLINSKTAPHRVGVLRIQRGGVLRIQRGVGVRIPMVGNRRTYWYTNLISFRNAIQFQFVLRSVRRGGGGCFVVCWLGGGAAEAYLVSALLTQEPVIEFRGGAAEAYLVSALLTQEPVIEFNIKSEMRKGSGGYLRMDEDCVGINSLFPAHIF